MSEDVRLDHGRAVRTGLPEVIFAEHKTREQIERIARSLHAASGFALATRLAAADGASLAAALPEAAPDDPVSRVLQCGELPATGLRVAVVCAWSCPAFARRRPAGEVGARRSS